MEAVEARDIPPEGVGEAPQVDQDLATVRALLTEGRVEQARALSRELAVRYPGSEAAQRYSRMLAPPVARLRPDIKAQSREQEHAWLREQAHAYPGQWLAVLGDRLLASSSDFRAMMATLRQTPDGDRALLHFHPGPR